MYKKILNLFILIGILLVYSSLVYAVSSLSITNLDVRVGGNKDSDLINGDGISIAARPGDEIEFALEIRNTFSDETEIEDIEVEIIIKGIDDENDLEKEAKDFDLNAREDKNIRIDFKIPLEVEEERYDVIIKVTGLDENDIRHEIEWILKLEVIKEEHKVIINKLNLNPEIVSCNRIVNLEIELVNIGEFDEDNVYFEIINTNLEIYIKEEDIELEEGLDDIRYEDSFRLVIGEFIASGTYPILVHAYYDDIRLRNSKTVDLIIKDCERVETVTEPVKVEKPVVETQTIAPLEQPVITPVTTKIAITDTPNYVTILFISSTILTGIMLSMMGFIFIKYR